MAATASTSWSAFYANAFLEVIEESFYLGLDDTFDACFTTDLSIVELIAVDTRCTEAG